MKPEDILFDLRQMTKKNPWQGISLYIFRMTEMRKYPRLSSQRRWSGIMRYLVNQRKIEIFGPDQRIRILLNDFQKNTENEIPITDDLILDIVSEISPCTPNEAIWRCGETRGKFNAVSFDRRMRTLAQIGKLFRDKDNRYSLTKPRENNQTLMSYA